MQSDRKSKERRRFKAEHNEHRRYGLSDSKPSDSPPPASRYAQSHTCRPDPPIKVPAARAGCRRRAQASGTRSDRKSVACGDEIRSSL